LQVIVLAVVQGLTEFLPISSTAHLYLSSWLLGWETQSLNFDIMLHLGTLLAVLVYFFQDWLQIIGQGFGIRMRRDPDLAKNPMLLWLLAAGSLPIGLAGLVFHDQAENTWRNPFVMGGMLIGVGIIMWLADASHRGSRDLSSLNLPDAVTIGFAQTMAIVPGCSRSGITISAGLSRHFSRESAARFSFLLSTPAIVAAAGKALWDIHKQGGFTSLLSTQFLVGVSVSALTGCAVIAWFLHYLRRGGLRPFVYYRIVFGIIVIILWKIKDNDLCTSFVPNQKSEVGHGDPKCRWKPINAAIAMGA
jgi:undecaprenyl-diphosphatase